MTSAGLWPVRPPPIAGARSGDPGSGGSEGPVGPVGLQALVDAWCRDSGRPLYGPDPGHVCGPGCTVLGVWPHQVCAESRQEHHCGGLGSCRFLASTGEGTVCTFSGRVLGGVADTVPSHGDPHWGYVSPRCGSRRFHPAAICLTAPPPPRCDRGPWPPGVAAPERAASSAC